MLVIFVVKNNKDKDINQSVMITPNPINADKNKILYLKHYWENITMNKMLINTISPFLS